MLQIAFKNLTHDQTRFVISLLGVAFAVVLILTLEGFGAGVFEQASAYSRNSGAELFVIQDGVDGMQSTRSIIPQNLAPKLAEIKGVRHVAGVFAAPVIFDRESRKTPVVLIGYRPADNMGGPWKLASGRLPKRRGEVVFDLALALRNDVAVDDSVAILGENFKVVGLSQETTSWMNPYIFMVRSEATRLLSAEGSVSYFLIHLRPGASVRGVQRRVERAAAGNDVLTARGIARNDTAILEDILSSPLTVMIWVSYIIGTLVIGLTVYSAVFAKLKEYGIIRAIGASNAGLYIVVFWQALILTIVGLAAGVGLSFFVANRIEASFPQFMVAITADVIERTSFIALAMGAIAALLPARMIGKVEPADVFRV